MLDSNTKGSLAIIALLVPVMLLIAGCQNSEEFYAAVEERAKSANDLEARAVTSLGCTVDLAAWGRLEDMRKRVGTFHGCVPDAEMFARQYLEFVGN